jgi:hypothetical protein
MQEGKRKSLDVDHANSGKLPRLDKSKIFQDFCIFLHPAALGKLGLKADQFDDKFSCKIYFKGITKRKIFERGITNHGGELSKSLGDVHTKVWIILL